MTDNHIAGLQLHEYFMFVNHPSMLNIESRATVHGCKQSTAAKQTQEPCNMPNLQGHYVYFTMTSDLW